MFDKNICLTCAPDILCLIAIHKNLHPLMPSRNDLFQNISTFTTYCHYLDIMALFKTIYRPLEALKVVFGSILFALCNASFCQSGPKTGMHRCLARQCHLYTASMTFVYSAVRCCFLSLLKPLCSYPARIVSLCKSIDWICVFLYSNASTTFLEPSPWFLFTCSMTSTFFFNVSLFLLLLLALFVIIAIDPCGQAVYLQELFPTSKPPCSWPANL